MAKSLKPFSYTVMLCISFKQVWGISENRDQSYRSNARPRLTSAGLPSLVSYLTTVSLFSAIEIRFLVYPLALFTLILSIFFWMHSVHVARSCSAKQTNFLEKIQQIQPSPDTIMEFFNIRF